MTHDIIDTILIELWEIRNPDKQFDTHSFEEFKKDWVEKHQDIPHDTYVELTTARNKNLISNDQQEKLRKTIVAFFGLSVGSNAVMSWMIESRADLIKIVDPDTISATNLNRIQAAWSSIGAKKIDDLTSRLVSINPFVTIDAFTDVTPEMVSHIVDEDTHIVVDEIDSFDGKILLRKLARDRKIPLISAADVGDNVILDIERYDIEPETKMFLGRIEDAENIDIAKLSPRERQKLIIELVGFEAHSLAMIDSLKDIGKTIRTWPQLGATASIAGGILATTIKKIRLGEYVKSGRYIFSLDKLLVTDFHPPQETIQEIKKSLSIS